MSGSTSLDRGAHGQQHAALMGHGGYRGVDAPRRVGCQGMYGWPRMRSDSRTPAQCRASPGRPVLRAKPSTASIAATARSVLSSDCDRGRSGLVSGLGCGGHHGVPAALGGGLLVTASGPATRPRSSRPGPWPRQRAREPAILRAGGALVSQASYLDVRNPPAMPPRSRAGVVQRFVAALEPLQGGAQPRAAVELALGPVERLPASGGHGQMAADLLADAILVEPDPQPRPGSNQRLVGDVVAAVRGRHQPTADQQVEKAAPDPLNAGTTEAGNGVRKGSPPSESETRRSISQRSSPRSSALRPSYRRSAEAATASLMPPAAR